MSREDELIRDALKTNVTASNELNNKILRTAERKKSHAGLMRAAVTVALCFIVFFGTVTAVNAATGGAITDFIKGKFGRKKDPVAVKTITFAVPSNCRIDEKNLELFNEALVEDGHHYKLEIKPIMVDENYLTNLQRDMGRGQIDVATLGYSSIHGNEYYDVVRSGLVMNLDEILSSGKGKVIYDAFPEKLWETAKCGDQIYSIPQTRWRAGKIYVAFNRDYVSQAEIDGWDGSIEGLYEILYKLDWDDSVAPRLQYLIDDDSFTGIFGCYTLYGLLYDSDTVTIENPLESDEFISYLETVYRMRKDGYMTDDVNARIYADEYSEVDYNLNVTKNLNAGRFAVAISSWYDDFADVFSKNNIVLKEIQSDMVANLRASVVISQNTKDVDAVVDFLSLLYANDKYANILLYGKKGTDYQLVNGLVYDMDGANWTDQFFNKVSLNLYHNTYPVYADGFTGDPKEELFDYYETVSMSPFMGFEPDTTGIGEIQEIVRDYWIDVMLNKADSFEDITANAKKKLKEAGMDTYLESVRKQWEELQKNKIEK